MALNVLDRLRKAVNTDQKELLVLYSSPGTGKTSFASQFPKPLFVTDGRDGGYADLVRAGQVSSEIAPIETTTWSDLREVTKALANPDTPVDCQTVVFENLGGFQLSLVELQIERGAKADNTTTEAARTKFLAWGGQGYKGCVAEFSDWLTDVRKILERNGCDGKPMRVILLGHSTLVKDKNPAGEIGEEFHRVDLDLHNELLKVLHRDVGCIGWMRQRPVVVKSDKGNRALSEDIREIVFHPSPNATAKNRWGLPPEPISMGKSAKEAFAFFSAAVAQAKASNTSKGESK
jgi:hypothetical protein